ncbi:MAG: sulfatase-like hydrolase/transferase [Brumimicrobium sp.]
MKLSSIVPSYFLRLIERLGITLLMMTLTRIIFYLANLNKFDDVTFLDFLAGIWIDCIAIGIWFIPFYAFSLLPHPFRKKKWYAVSLKVLFHITNTLMIAFNLLDVEYFKYTAKRSTSDLFTFFTEGKDFYQLIGSFLYDFWWLILTLAFLVILSNWLYNKSLNRERSKTNTKVNYLKQSAVFFIGAALLFIMGRGGLGFRPADMLTASKLTNSDNTALVLNTPLAIIKTIGKKSLIERDFYDKTEKNKIYNPIQTGTSNHKIGKDLNVMVIIMESFGNEWLGKVNNGPYTPFLDSLIDESLYFSNAFANGKKSIEAVPAIFASIPSLLDNPYISSHYGMNSIKALPHLLEKKGYSSGFYHGATNGSMKFDDFAAHAGFDNYFGRNEYNNEDHSDDAWGIADEYFMPWTAESITNNLPEPFLAGLFSLSSHHPYIIPEKYKDQLPNGPHPMAKAIAYADMSLKLFFKEAKKQSWYKNTIFVICADHTPAGTSLQYAKRVGMYQIPILFFDPKDRIKPEVSDKLFNQIDILPTLLDYLGYNSNYYAFGNSHFKNHSPFVINYIGNTYHYLEDDYMINFVDDATEELYNYKMDTLLYKDSLQFYTDEALKMESKLKGIIQRYNYDLIHNEMKVK